MDTENETAQFKEQCLKHLDDVLRDIHGFGDDVYAIDDGRLAALNMRKAEPLDIDDRTVDFGPRFFYPRFTLDQARQKTTDYFADHEEEREVCIWPKRCRRGSFDEEDFWGQTPSTGPPDPEARHPLCDAMSEAGRRLKWFLGALGEDAPDPSRPSSNLGVWEGSEWHFWPGERLEGNLPGHFGHQARIGGFQQEYSFYVNYACLITDDATELPHIGGTVIDSAEPKDEEVLRSEVIVFSFQHDRFGRVTQFHFDGRGLVLRQSRLLNFQSDEPTVDAYHMIRWMANRPMGQTRFREVAEECPLEQGMRDVDKNSDLVPVEA